MKFNVDKIKVGERIFNIRNSLNLTLEQFGKDKDINAERSNASKWERGATLPNRSRLKAIAKKGNMTVNELLYGSIDEYFENNIDTLLKNNSILKEDTREVFVNTYKVIDKTKEIARNENIDLNDIESLNRICNRVILEIKDDIRKNSKPIPLWASRETPITFDTLSMILLEWLYKYIEETNVTKEQAKKDITVKINELINKL